LVFRTSSRPRSQWGSVAAAFLAIVIRRGWAIEWHIRHLGGGGALPSIPSHLKFPKKYSLKAVQFSVYYSLHTTNTYFYYFNDAFGFPNVVAALSRPRSQCGSVASGLRFQGQQINSARSWNSPASSFTFFTIGNQN